MERPYVKFNLEQLEKHFNLYYLNKYHDLCMDMINNTNDKDNNFVDNLDINFTKKYLNNKIKSRLYSIIIKNNNIEKMKKLHQKKINNKLKKQVVNKN